MAGLVALAFLLVSLVSFFLAPGYYSKPFCVWEMITFLMASAVFLHHKVRRNGLICFDTFFLPTYFLINYAHAVFIFPDDEFLPAFKFVTNTNVMSYALALAQAAIAFYMMGSLLFEKDWPAWSNLRVEVPDMAVNRAAYIGLAASLGLFAFVFIMRGVEGFHHLYPRLMAMILSLIALSWYFQAQLVDKVEANLMGMVRRNKINIVSTMLFSLTQLYLGSRGVVLFLLLMITLLINAYYWRIKMRVLLPVLTVGLVLMGFLAVTRVSSYSVASVSMMESVRYGVEVIGESPSILWMLLTDFVVNAKTLYDSVDYSHMNGYLMGVAYVQYLFVFLPFGGSFFTKLLTGLDMEEVRTGNILSEFADATYGLGTNMIGDLYMNFSFIGVFVLLFLLGVLVAWVEFPRSKYQYFIYMALFANCIYLVRADIFSWLTYFVFFVIFDWLMRIHIGSDAEPVSD